MQSTIAIFRHLYNNLPPLVPGEAVSSMETILAAFERGEAGSTEEVEEAMVKFGYEVWPWNQAYKFFLHIAEEQLGEHFLLPRLSPEVQERYRKYKELGMTLSDLHSGNAAADYFSPDERVELCVALVETQRDLRAHVNVQVVGLERQEYEEKVEEYAVLLEQIEENLENLRLLAESETDHPGLADEIMSRIKSFEHGLCLLGPELNYEAVCQSMDFFKGRKQDLNRLRGIHVPAKVDLYED